MKKPLQERIILAAIKAWKKGDPMLVIGIGDREVRIAWLDGGSNDNTG